VLVNLTPDNYADYVYEAKKILGVTITDGQMKAALKVYASYSETYRQN